MEGEVGLEILSNTDFNLLLNRLLTFTAHTILKDSQIVFEDKLIAENCTNLLLGILMHKPSLFVAFKDFSGYGDNKIKSTSELVLTGILYCPEEKIREYFKNCFAVLSQSNFDALTFTI